MKLDGYAGAKPKVRYRDQKDPAAASLMGSAAGHLMAQQRATLEQAIGIGRQTRRETGGDGLDIIRNNLADGTWPDVLEASKRRSAKVW